jgi:hypothetical protein
MEYLSEKHGGNPHDRGIVRIMSSSIFRDNPKVAPRVLADITTETGFISESRPNQWVCCDFREMRLYLTKVSIGKGTLISWALEGSLDGEDWTEIRRRRSDRGYWASDRFERWDEFPVSSATGWRFIRLTQTGKNVRGFDHLEFCFLEFWGILYE